MIDLFAHNQVAYEAAIAMLSETGKAAIIHPTGTGKSFIGFKLCEDHPHEKICWLSPSEYIFQTQLENLAAVSNGYRPENIVFFTYAKLMKMQPEEIAAVSPDYIILDEFHRAGAAFWGQGVRNLLDAFPHIPILGLSATNIRYLDNQRDMAQELFDCNIASEMTLGEAIVRGILSAPKYVVSVYAYQNELDAYQKRAVRARNKVVRDEAERYLEALRHTLENAEGIDKLFEKHMTEPHGKYIVFCANAEHMTEMTALAPQWFRNVDTDPHIYTAYSDDPETSRAFAAFKTDSSEHLKLLYCIDMLNEGVHIDDVSGVILLRPTVSPIIYKQQIGRALAAGKKNNAVIFDIVMNIENLYSIGAVEEEMQVAMTYYRAQGLESEIVHEQFQVIGEIRDCIALFDQLNETLSTSWNLMFSYAKQYYEEHGNLEVPKRYKTKDGYSLGSWILTQRKVYAGITYGVLGPDRIAKLDSIGMVWKRMRDASWNRYFAAAQQYAADYGNLNIKADYVTASGLQLGRWISNLRTWKKNNSQKHYLSEERIAALDRIGMIWEVSDYLWQQYYGACVSYYRCNGNLDVPLTYVTGDGVRLGVWLQNVRSSRRSEKAISHLSEEQIRLLDELGMVWNRRQDRLWVKGYQEALAYRKEHGNLDVPITWKTADGYTLGRWIDRQRNQESLSASRRKLLDDIGMIWKKPDPWTVRFKLAENYYREHGNLRVPGNYTVDGIWLNKWLNEQKQIKNGNRGKKSLSKEQIEKLESIGMVWESRSQCTPSPQRLDSMQNSQGI